MDFTRQMTLCDPSGLRHRPVTIVGAGGIGAAAALAMAKCGFEKLTVYDFDTLEEFNGPNQLLPLSASDRVKGDLFYGAYKVHALAHLIYDLTLTLITPVAERYVRQPLGEIAVSAVDSMAARQQIWQAAKGSLNTLFFLDGRMGRESLAIYAVDMMDEAAMEAYEGTLHTDEEALQVPCTEKATIFTNLQIASWITKIATAWCLHRPYPKVMRVNMAEYLVVAA